MIANELEIYKEAEWDMFDPEITTIRYELA
jgi:hypothetical protein